MGFIADFFFELIFEGVVVGTGTLILKAIRPNRRVSYGGAGIVGLLAWIGMIATAVIIGRMLFV